MTDLTTRIDALLEQTEGMTEGPWRRGQEGNLRIYGPDGRGAHSGLIAECCGRRDGSRPANTRAIAALPDLVKALREARAALAAERERGRVEEREACAEVIKRKIRVCQLKLSKKYTEKWAIIVAHLMSAEDEIRARGETND